MQIRNFLKSVVNRRKSNTRRSLARTNDLSEQLESRTLLTGNVQFSLVGANAYFTGDAGNNKFDVIVDDGSIVVRGLNGTTINNRTADFVLANGTTTFRGSLIGSLGTGNDVATIGAGMQFSGSVAISGDEGADTMRVLSGTYGELTLRGGDGANSIVVDGATVNGSAAVYGLGATIASITNSTVHGNLYALMAIGHGSDSVVVKSTTVDHVSVFMTGRGDDNVVLQESHLHGPLHLFTGSGDDVVYVDSSRVEKFALIATLSGNDNFRALNSSVFSRLLIYAGGTGNDGARIASDTSSHGVIRASEDQGHFDATSVASRITDPTTGAIAIANNLLATSVPSLTVSISKSTLAENAGSTAAALTVTRTGPTAEALVVTLTSSRPGKVTVPQTVTIPAGSTSVTANIAAVDNSQVDGDAVVTITAAAAGLVTGTAVVTVTDNDHSASGALTLVPNTASVTENPLAGTVTYTLSRSTTDLTQPLTVDLASGNTARLMLAGNSITIPANASSVTFVGSPVENDKYDGNVAVVVTASADGITDATASVTVTDNDIAVLTLTANVTSVSENVGTAAVTYTVSRNTTDLTQPLVVNLQSKAPNRLAVSSTVTIPANQTSVNFSGTVIDNSASDGNTDVEVTATASGFGNGTVSVTVTDDESQIALTATANATDAVESNGTIITRQQVAQVTGTTVAGATITIDSDGDGIFDDGTVTAGTNGNYSVGVTLTHTPANHGENQIIVHAVSGTKSANTVVNAHRAVGTVVHFATNLGAYDVELLDSEAPETVTNFLTYVDSGAYQNMFVHRANSGSAKFIQGGGFKVSNGQVSPVVTNTPVVNQFNPANGNIAGTLAMALPAGNINAGTSQWFVNAIDNSAGFDGGSYTVFGRVIGGGLSVVQQISNLPQTNLTTLYNSGALATVPLSDFSPANTTIVGQVSTTQGSKVLTGTGTQFTSELSVGQSIVIGSGAAHFVASIESNTSLTLTEAVTGTASNQIVKKDVVPADVDFVVFSSIEEILDTL